ncbi:MAG: hypothetical protein DA408_06840 [Bacteroidetes bacterium]|nr:MAG: hypothetical protein C7N36_12360 [Bacteroidota bacterium]PTM13421.1 MAG: hypothetical protein DA408_06840 [Bacteroidota bacterium]
MNEPSITLLKNPDLPLAEDYARLRAAGLAAIEELGNAQWTDYNVHDPGITLLEALTYALTEIGYRTGFDIADILTETSGYISFRQALFTARKILTNNPLTVNDFRKTLIDLPLVANGWLLCKQCACETTIYAACEEEALFHAPQWRLREPNDDRQAEPHEHPVFVRGLYEVLLQLDEDPELGDLNNHKLVQTLAIATGEGTALAPLTIELRFPDWASEQPDAFRQFISDHPDFAIDSVVLDRFSRDRVLAEPVSDASFAQGWRNLFFIDYTVNFREQPADPLQSIQMLRIPVRFFSPREAVKRTPGIVTLVSDILASALPGGLMDRYRRKLQATEEAVAATRHSLHNVRNLAEDFCRIQTIKTEDIAFCADVEVAADADIEYVLARIYFAIGQHFNPPVPFYTLSEMAATGLATEDIFWGPPLANGFIKDADLEAAQLQAEIHISDLYDWLMDIPGVVALKHVLFTRYDDEGNPIMPAHQWRIPLRPLHIPKLYEEASRVLFYKNELPFLARMDEVRAILAQLRGQLVQGKVPLAERDYPVPAGQHRELSTYVPVQHTLPLTYGIGPVGLPPRASNERRAQAHQLKAYLVPFEQLLADMTEQLAHVPDLFSTDELVDRTYFTHYFDAAAPVPEIADYPALVTAQATEANLRALAESDSTFTDRRNRFLDHMLGRFGEQFRDYALMLNANADRIPFSAEKLIRDKIRFLRFYPRISADRARAFNYRYTDRWCDPRNRAGLAERISRLLGMDMLMGYFNVVITSNQGIFSAGFQLTDTSPGGLGLLLEQSQLLTAATGEAVEEAAWLLIGDVIARSTETSNYVTNGAGDDELTNDDSSAIAVVATGIPPAQVADFARTILARERLYIVEHLLLRPVFPGSPLLPVCLGPDCNLCGEEDPYSFRLTYVVQGSLAPFSYDIDLRRFADQTIRRETPAHLLPKICWVGNTGLEKDECAPIFSQLIDILQQEQDLDAEAPETCTCAHDIYDGFDNLFLPWMADKTLLYRPRERWEADLRTLFQSLQAADFPCLASDNGWDTIATALLDHFVDLAVQAYQFDRFEAAWCAWLEANSPFLWQSLNEQLQRQTELWLQSALGMADPTTCTCARLLLAYFGDRYRQWIDQLVDAEADLGDLDSLRTELATTVLDAFWDDLQLAAANDPQFCPVWQIPKEDSRWVELQTIWLALYGEWITVAHRHNVLLRVFNDLRSIYPTATLHDCDDGSDDNPVRLDNTILGTL